MCRYGSASTPRRRRAWGPARGVRIPAWVRATGAASPGCRRVTGAAILARARAIAVIGAATPAWARATGAATAGRRVWTAANATATARAASAGNETTGRGQGLSPPRQRGSSLVRRAHFFFFASYSLMYFSGFSLKASRQPEQQT